MTKTTLGALLAVFALAVTLAAQSYTLSNTTLNGAIDNVQTTLVLTSASASSGSSFGNPAAGQCLFVDQELMRITSMSSTTATVVRARQNAAPHPTLAVVWTAACSAFKAADPPLASVSATAGNQVCSTQPRPWINTTNGNTWICNTMNNSWRGTNAVTFTYGSSPIAQ